MLLGFNSSWKIKKHQFYLFWLSVIITLVSAFVRALVLASLNYSSIYVIIARIGNSLIASSTFIIVPIIDT